MMLTTLSGSTNRHRCFTPVIVGATALIITSACGRSQETAGSGSGSSSPELVAVDTGVFAAIRKEPLSLAVNSNSLIIVRDTDVVVVDAQFTRAATQETIAAIRRITDKPVGYVINTHWHDDHVAGNQVYRDSFPSVRFVMQEHTAADMVTLGTENRKNQVAGAPPVAAEYERLLARGSGIDSTPASPLERASVASAIRIVRQYLEEHPGFRLISATDTVRRRMTIRGQPRIDLLWFGYGNTRGDLVVHLPERGVIATGDLVVAPVPLAFGSYPASWAGVLDSVIALQPGVVVPGHGPVMRDLGYVRSLRDWLRRIDRETSIVAARGDSEGVALETVTLEDVRESVAGDEKWMNFLFRRFFAGPAVRAAFQSAVRRSGGQAVGGGGRSDLGLTAVCSRSSLPIHCSNAGGSHRSGPGSGSSPPGYRSGNHRSGRPGYSEWSQAGHQHRSAGLRAHPPDT